MSIEHHNLDELEDWEEYDPTKGSFMLHAISGSFAGAMEHSVIFPIDTFKTFTQSEGTSVKDLYSEVSNKGISRIFRGIPIIFFGALPAHAAYFNLYESSKEYLGADGEELTFIKSGLCGAFAASMHDAIMTPMDCIKQRLQLGLYSGVNDAFKNIVKQEGFSALYASYPTTLLMNLPFAVISVSVNENIKKIINPNNEYNLPAFLLSGAIAGAVAGAITNPLDIAKTRLQTQHLYLQTHNQQTQNNNQQPKTQNNQSSSSSSRYNNKSVFAKNSSLFNRQLIRAYPPISTVRSYRNKYTIGYNNNSNCDGPISSKPPSITGTTTWCARDGIVCNISECKVTSTTTNPPRYHGLSDALYRIYLEDGLRGYLKGIGPRVGVSAPAVAISWASYESAKSFLKSTEYFND